MVIKVGINGFGRIGRVISRVCLQHSDLQLSAINDPAISVEYISYLIKFDSTHGKLKGNITHTDEEISVDDKHIKVFHEKLPQSVPWHTAGVQYVVEASGMFTNLEKASGHLASDGVKRVIVTAPSVDVPMIILGVNDNILGIDQKVLSCASSTLYCLAPIIKVLEDQFGVSEGFITSIHAMTPSLKPLDGLCLRGKHWRDHRSIHQNIIPATTGACKALGKIIPQVKDKLSGLAFRVPIVNVSVLDLTIRLNSNTSIAEIVKCVEKASKNNMQNIIKISNDEAVSSDFIGESHSCIFDEDSSIQLKPNFFKIICWYENEYSYACRVADSILFSEKQFDDLVFSSKMTYVRPRSLRKQDCMQQTESYKKEMSVSCCEYKSEVSSKLTCSAYKEKVNKVPSRQFMKKPLLTETTSSLPNYNKKKNELFKIWHDSSETTKPIVKQTRGSFFQSCMTMATSIPKQKEDTKAPTRLENVKREFSKMVNITEDLLKKTHSNQSDVHLMSKNEFINKSDPKLRTKDKHFLADIERYKKTENDPVENCGDCRSLSQSSKNLNQGTNESSNEEEVSSYSYEKDVTDFAISDNKIIEKKDNIRVTQSVNIPKTTFPKKEVKVYNNETVAENIASKLHHDEFKQQLAKTINTLIEGLTNNIQARCSTDDAKPNSSDVEKMKINNEQIKENCMDTEASVAVLSQSGVCDKKLNEMTIAKQLLIDSTLHLDQKVNLFEKYKMNNDNTNVKLIDKELRKRNIVLVDNPFVAETISDENMYDDSTVENVEPKKNINRQVLERLERNPETVVVVSEHTSRCNSPENTNTTISNRNENKQDIYDKLDSASATDSNNSFEINERKSQVIHITDLTNSFEDLARLDKICRIIEISDELSDKLFSALDNKDDNELKRKRWSFRDLCERIHLDEFCNKVFGRTAA